MSIMNNSIGLSSKIYVAGHCGMVGSAIIHRLQASGYSNFVTNTHAELDLLSQAATANFLMAEN